MRVARPVEALANVAFLSKRAEAFENVGRHFAVELGEQKLARGGILDAAEQGAHDAEGAGHDAAGQT